MVNMKILVNGETLGFELEHELPLTGIIEHVSTWARDRNMHILDYRVDLAQGADRQNEPTSSQIELLDIELGSRADLIYANLQELDAYLDRMGVFLAQHISEEKPVS